MPVLSPAAPLPSTTAPAGGNSNPLRAQSSLAPDKASSPLLLHCPMSSEREQAIQRAESTRTPSSSHCRTALFLFFPFIHTRAPNSLRTTSNSRPQSHPDNHHLSAPFHDQIHSENTPQFTQTQVRTQHFPFQNSKHIRPLNAPKFRPEAH